MRERARQHLERGNRTSTYVGDVNETIGILQSVLATEIVCVLRYTMHAVAASGISSDSVKAEFAQHAKEEREHMMSVAERINQLGGKPNFNPEGLVSRSASQYVEGENLVDMIRENLIAERIAVEHYRELIRFGDDDLATKSMLQKRPSRVERNYAVTTCMTSWSRMRESLCCRNRTCALGPLDRAGLPEAAGGLLA